MGKGRTKPAVMPIDRTGEDRPLLFVGWIDALPVPAALVRPLARGNFRLHASNATQLLSLESCDVGICPTQWQRSRHPAATWITHHIATTQHP